MNHILDLVEFALNVVAAVVFFGLIVLSVFTGRLYLGRRVSVSYRERPGTFLSWFLLFAWVAFACSRDATEFIKHFSTP